MHSKIGKVLRGLSN